MKPLAILLYPLGLLLRRKRAGTTHSIRNAPELAAAETSTLHLASPAFPHGATMPLRHATMDLGPNISPALAWEEPPADTRQMLPGHAPADRQCRSGARRSWRTHPIGRWMRQSAPHYPPLMTCTRSPTSRADQAGTLHGGRTRPDRLPHQ